MIYNVDVMEVKQQIDHGGKAFNRAVSLGAETLSPKGNEYHLKNLGPYCVFPNFNNTCEARVFKHGLATVKLRKIDKNFNRAHVEAVDQLKFLLGLLNVQHDPEKEKIANYELFYMENLGKVKESLQNVGSGFYIPEGVRLYNLHFKDNKTGLNFHIYPPKYAGDLAWKTSIYKTEITGGKADFGTVSHTLRKFHHGEGIYPEIDEWNYTVNRFLKAQQKEQRLERQRIGLIATDLIQSGYSSTYGTAILRNDFIYSLEHHAAEYGIDIPTLRAADIRAQIRGRIEPDKKSMKKLSERLLKIFVRADDLRFIGVKRGFINEHMEDLDRLRSLSLETLNIISILDQRRGG